MKKMKYKYFTRILQPDGHFYLEEPKQLGVETKFEVKNKKRK
jgi:hypothetical protein